MEALKIDNLSFMYKPWKTILGNTSVGLELNGYSKKEARRMAASYFKGFGLEGTEKYYPHELS